MMHWSRAARAVRPQLTRYGVYDFARLFTVAHVLAQQPTGCWDFTWAAGLNNHADNLVGPVARPTRS